MKFSKTIVIEMLFVENKNGVNNYSMTFTIYVQCFAKVT